MGIGSSDGALRAATLVLAGAAFLAAEVALLHSAFRGQRGRTPATNGGAGSVRPAYRLTALEAFWSVAPALLLLALLAPLLWHPGGVR